MTIKITKQLATMEDLAIGTGTVVQERNGVPLTLTKIDFTATVSNVAEMQERQTVVGIVIQTLGYYSEGDGGGNTYEVVAGGTGTDDGGTFIDMANGLQAKGLFKNVASTLQYGATQSKLGSVIEKLSVIGVKDIFVEVVGYLNNTDTIEFSNITDTNITFLSTLVESSIIDAPILKISNLSFCKITLPAITGAENFASWDAISRPRITIEESKNCIIETKKITNCSSVIKLTECDNCYLYVNKMVGILTSKTILDDRISVAVNFFRGQGNKVIGGEFISFGNAILQEMGGQKLLISGSIIKDSIDNGIYISSGDNCKVVNCHVEGLVVDSLPVCGGIKMRGRKNICSNNTILDTADSIMITGYGTAAPSENNYTSWGTVVECNVIEGFDGIAIRLDSFDQGDGSLGFVKNATVSGNTIKNNYASNITPAIRLLEVTNINISNNTFDDISGNVPVIGVFGSQATPCSNITISGNVFTSISSDEIIRATYAVDLLIVNNNVEFETVLSGFACEIRNSNRGIITGNIFSDRINVDQDFLSTNFIIANNIVSVFTPQNDPSNLKGNELIV